MNAAEHIVQSFFWHAESEKKPKGRRYLTISNVIGGNNSEIDILAMSGDGQDKLRVESHVDVNWPTTPDYVNYLKDCIRKKMLDDKHSRKFIREQFGWEDDGYRKIFVVWNNPFTDIQVLRDELEDDTVDCWSIADMLQDMLESAGTSNYQDDILRLMSMLSSMLSVGAALRDIECKPVSPSVNNVTTKTCIDTVAALAKKHQQNYGKKTVTDAHVLSAVDEILRLAHEDDY